MGRELANAIRRVGVQPLKLKTQTAAKSAAKSKFMSDNRAVQALLLEGLNDMLSLGWIEQTVGLLEGKKPNDHGLIRPTLMAISDLLKMDYAVAGYVVKDPEDGLLMVDAWGLSLEGTIERIEKEWNELGKLGLGDVVWLELTDKGRQEARRLDAVGCDPFKQ